MEQLTKVKYLNTYPEELKPQKQGDAGIDIVASKDVTIGAFETILVPTGLYLEIPEGYYGRLVGRSSLHKEGLHVNEGIIDSGYRGEVMVSMSNLNYDRIIHTAMGVSKMIATGSEEYESHNSCISKGDRIAQLIITKVEPVEYVAVDELSDSERGNGGFGSSGR